MSISMISITNLMIDIHNIDFLENKTTSRGGFILVMKLIKELSLHLASPLVQIDVIQLYYVMQPRVHTALNHVLLI